METIEHTKKPRKDAVSHQGHCAIPTLRGFSVCLVPGGVSLRRAVNPLDICRVEPGGSIPRTPTNII